MKAPNWVEVLNDQSDWQSDSDAAPWFGKLIGKKDVQIPPDNLRAFHKTLCQMRELIYDYHFEGVLELKWLKEELARIEMIFDWTRSQPSLPILRAKASTESDADLLDSLRGGLILQFASDLAQSLAAGEGIAVQRCEGLYKNARAQQVSIVPEVSEDIEQKWRKEIPVLVEKALESEVEIQRCADLFSGSSRSKYCSDTCRFSTFQIIKQLKEPNYLAEKQRRYRNKSQ